MSKREGKGPEVPEIPGAWQSRAFFAALLAATRGDDQKAGEILRDIAQSLVEEFSTKEVSKRG